MGWGAVAVRGPKSENSAHAKLLIGGSIRIFNIIILDGFRGVSMFFRLF